MEMKTETEKKTTSCVDNLETETSRLKLGWN